MKQKILSLLVLLLTAATGAWADKVQENISILAADWNAGSGTYVTNDGDLMKVILTSEWGIAAYAWAQPVDLSNCDKLVVVVVNMNGCDGEHYKLRAFLQDETLSSNAQMEAYVGLDDDDNLQHEMVFDFTQQTNLDLTKVKKLGIQCQPNGAEYKISRVYIEKEAPKAEVEVTTDAASEGATFTEASFQMPAFDATADYELVRDMSVQMTAQVGTDPEAQPRYRVKKDGSNWIPADMEMAAVPALFTVNDAIEQKALTPQNYIVQIYAIDAEGQPTGEPMTFATFTFEPGIYAVKAVAADGSDYDGETALSNTFKLFMGYEVEVAAKEFITYYKDEPLYADTETSADAQLYTISSVNDTQAVLSSAIETAPSSTPLLIFNNSDEAKTFLLIPAEAEPNLTLNIYAGFKGTLTGETIAASTATQTNYALNGKAFVWVKDAIEIGANKCWLSVESASNARQLAIVFENDVTGITGISGNSGISGTFYDLNGRKIAQPTKKGIYILNGRKVVVR